MIYCKDPAQGSMSLFIFLSFLFLLQNIICLIHLFGEGSHDRLAGGIAWAGLISPDFPISEHTHTPVAFQVVPWRTKTKTKTATETMAARSIGDRAQLSWLESCQTNYLPHSRFISLGVTANANIRPFQFIFKADMTKVMHVPTQSSPTITVCLQSSNHMRSILFLTRFHTSFQIHDQIKEINE